MDKSPKEFIQDILIDQVGDIAYNSAYPSFALIAIGIEFLGKCMLTQYQDWHEIPVHKAYDKGVELMAQVDKRYDGKWLRTELRNGFAHTFIPKGKVWLSERKHEAVHFKEHDGGHILVIEDFHRDFANACRIIINKDFPIGDKMNAKTFLAVRDI